MVVFHVLQWTYVDFPTGQAGVDVFFVISGFVMWIIGEREAVTPLAFLRRRAARIVPPYWTLTLAAAGAAIAAPDLFREIRFAPDHLFKSLAFWPHRDPRGDPFPLLAPGWTLIYEVYFYAWFALALAFGRRWRLWIITGALTFTAVIGFFIDGISVFGANPLMLEFVAGVWIGKAWTERRLPSGATGWGLITCALLAFAGLQAVHFDTPLFRPLLWGGPAVLTVLGAVSVEAGRRGPPSPRWDWLRRLGDASYSIYLVHPLVVAAVPRLIGIDRPLLFAPVVVALSIGLGLLCRVLIEKPSFRLLAGRRPPPLADQPA